MIEKVKEIVAQAAQFMLPGAPLRVTEKDGCANIVTSADLAVQHFLQTRLAALLPGCGFVCEEEDVEQTQPSQVWVIDPIDGTANFARGTDHCAICVGLCQEGKMRLGVVYMPRTGEMFWAERGKGAWRGSERISVSDRPFANGILCTALPVYHKEYAPVCSAIILEAFGQCNDLRRLGSAATELCYVAMGRFDLYFEYLLGAWDYAAASLILEEAGGCLCGLDGHPLNPLRPSGVLAANTPASLRRLHAIVSRHLAPAN